MPIARIVATEILQHRQRLDVLPRILMERLWLSLRVTSQELTGGIKGDMPVLTGRARSGWGQWTPQDIVAENPEANSGDAVYQEDKSQLTIIQGTNVPYVSYLNAGSSTQAPAGFIDLNVEHARRNMRARAQDIGFEVVNSTLRRGGAEQLSMWGLRGLPREA